MPYILQNLLLWVQPGQQYLLLVTPYVQYNFKLTNTLKGYRQTQENLEHAHVKQLVLSWLHIFTLNKSSAAGEDREYVHRVTKVATSAMASLITHDFDRLASNEDLKGQ